MSQYERHHTLGCRAKETYVINGLSPSAWIRAGHARVSVGDVVAGMNIQLADGALATVLSAHSYWTDAQQVQLSAGHGEMSLCSEAYLACAHPMCELYFGCSQVAYPIKAMVGYDPAFSLLPRKEFSERISLELDQVGWIQLNGLCVFIPPVPPNTKVMSNNTASNEEPFRHMPSLYNQLILSPEETIVLSTFNCALTSMDPMPCATGSPTAQSSLAKDKIPIERAALSLDADVSPSRNKRGDHRE